MMKLHSCKDTMKIVSEGSFKKLGLTRRMLYLLHFVICKNCRQYKKSMDQLNDTIKGIVEKKMTDSKLSIEQTQEKIINDVLKK